MGWLDGQLGGVVVGFVLSLAGTWALDLWRDARPWRAVRTMLRVEVERSVAVLDDLARTLPAKGKRVRGEEPAEARSTREWSVLWHRAAALTDRPLAPWTQTVWSGQAALVPRALKRDEISRVAAFYAALDELAALRSSLADARAADREAAPFEADEPFRAHHLTEFEKRVSQTRDNIASLVVDALHKGRACLAFLD